MNKIINILKPTGMTSHDVVSCVRRTLNMKKVGHTGTQVLVSKQEKASPLDGPQVTPIAVKQATDQAPVSVSASPESSVLPKTGQTENLLALMGVSLLTFLGSFVYPRKKH